jgi:hypothetical protein
MNCLGEKFGATATRAPGADASHELPVLLVTGYNRTAADVSGESIVMRKPAKLSERSCVAARMIADAKQPPHHQHRAVTKGPADQGREFERKVVLRIFAAASELLAGSVGELSAPVLGL